MREKAERRIWCATFRRDRRELLPLFKLADDSEEEILAHLYLGEVLFAVQSDRIIGCAQVIEAGSSTEFELKSIAVLESHQRQGIGERLIRAAVRYCRAHSARRLIVSTSIAASAAVAFYLRNGFRICGFVPDAFTPEKGYPATEGETGLPLNDAVVFELLLDPTPPEHRKRNT